jgi:hypothetical protein
MGRKILAAAALLLSLCSCVKEDREDCPCRLDLFFTGEHLPCVISLESGEKAYLDTVRSAGTFSVNVLRGKVRLYACSGAGKAFDPRRGLIVQEGKECPPVYMCSKVIEATGEIVRDTVRLDRNHCKITLKIKTDDGRPLNGYTLALGGGVCGYDMEGSPLRGPFSFVAKVSSDSEYACTVPRQVDNSLELEIRDEPDAVRKFPVGEFIAESGYDWTRKDLEDIVMEIDYSRTGVTFRVSGWTRTIKMDVVI